MASRSTLNAKNLATLGAERLAKLLIEISTGSAVAKRRLRLELAEALSPKEAGREVAKRLPVAQCIPVRTVVRIVLHIGPNQLSFLCCGFGLFFVHMTDLATRFDLARFDLGDEVNLPL